MIEDKLFVDGEGVLRLYPGNYIVFGVEPILLGDNFIDLKMQIQNNVIDWCIIKNELKFLVSSQ